MNKLLMTAVLISLSACVEEGPPNYNERDRRAYNSLEETRPNAGPRCYPDGYCEAGYYNNPAAPAPAGYYDANHVWHTYNDGYDHSNDYNPTDGHDRWARQSN